MDDKDDIEHRNLPVPSSRRDVARFQPPRVEVTPWREPGKPSRRAFLEAEIARIIKDRPEDAARLIRSWLAEDEDEA